MCGDFCNRGNELHIFMMAGCTYIHCIVRLRDGLLGHIWKECAWCERRRGNGNIEKVLRVLSAVVECFGAVLYLKSVNRACANHVVEVALSCNCLI